MIVTVRQENIIDTLPLISLIFLYVCVIVTIGKWPVGLFIPFNDALYFDRRLIAGLSVIVIQTPTVLTRNHVTRGFLLLLRLLLPVQIILRGIVIFWSVSNFMASKVLFHGERFVAYVALIRQRFRTVVRVSGQMHHVIMFHNKRLPASLAYKRTGHAVRLSMLVEIVFARKTFTTQFTFVYLLSGVRHRVSN